MEDAEELIQQGYAAHHSGDLELALELYQAAADALRPLSEPLHLAHTIRHVADIQSSLHRFDDAYGNYAEALALYRAHPETRKLDLANTLRGYALLQQAIGEAPTARDLWTEARELYRAVDIQAGVDEADRRLSQLHAL